MESISELGTEISNLGIKAYIPFALLMLVIVVSIILASYTFPDDEDGD